MPPPTTVLWLYLAKRTGATGPAAAAVYRLPHGAQQAVLLLRAHQQVCAQRCSGAACAQKSSHAVTWIRRTAPESLF